MKEKRIDTGTFREELGEILMAARGLIVYRELNRLPALRRLTELLEGLLERAWRPARIIEGYNGFLNAFLSSIPMDQSYDCSWMDWVLDAVLYTENKLTLWAEKHGSHLPKAMSIAVESDLRSIQRLADIPWQDLVEVLGEETDGFLPVNIFPMQGADKWQQVCARRGLKSWDTEALAEYYSLKGSGIFSSYYGFYWDGSSLKGIKNTDPITLDRLLGYDIQKQVLLDNTERFVSGYPANNVLLYGDKGTGKSSMVKALIHEFGDRGLRMIELPKKHLDDYYSIIKYIEDRMYRFILFVDDLSFEEHEVEYKHVKALLEGGLQPKPSNLLVYATSNRRHLVKEVVADRSSVGYNYNDRSEISPTDSMQEKLSLADRFGITLTFISPNQEAYLEMVEAMAGERGLDIDREVLRAEALRWEKRYNGRSGRTAKQFIDHIEGGL